VGVAEAVGETAISAEVRSEGVTKNVEGGIPEGREATG